MYQIIKTHYHQDTPDAVKRVLENAMHSRRRLRLFYGDAVTGKDWGEEYDVLGYIGRSGGNVKIPLLVNNRRSLGGPAILDHCIVKIMDGRRTLYEHPHYDAGHYEINDDHEVARDGETVARFKSHKQAANYVAYMLGQRSRK